MGVQVCGAHDEDAARSLARNPFVSNFSGCLKVAKEDVKDTFESSEKRSENNITVEPFIEEKVLAFNVGSLGQNMLLVEHRSGTGPIPEEEC